MLDAKTKLRILNMKEMSSLPEKCEYLIAQSGRGHRDDRAKFRLKNIQRFDHKMGSRGRFETFDI